MPAGPPFMREAVEFNVITFFGWVADTATTVTALKG
jgi:hypothetical protein